MGLEDQNNQEHIPRTLVQKITRNTYSDGESEKTLEVYNIEGAIKSGAYQFFAEKNNNLVLVKDSIDSDADVKIVKFIPGDETDYLEVNIEGETFKGEISLTNKNFIAIYSESPHVKPGVTIHVPKTLGKGYTKVLITEENIEKYKYRKLVFKSIDFSNEDCYLGFYDKNGFHEVTDIQSSGSFYKYAVTAILGTVIGYGANNLSLSSDEINDFTTQTTQKINNNLQFSGTETKEAPVLPGDGAYDILSRAGISNYDKQTVDKIKLNKGDILTIKHQGSKLVSIENQNGRKFY